MKSLFSFFAGISVLVWAPIALGQAPADSGSFCRHDPRPEVRAYCTQLGRLQAAVTAAKSDPSQTVSVDNPHFRVPLKQLNVTDEDATVDFITATSGILALKSAIADALRSADQARPDQQLGTDSKASGTTSLVSKAGSAELLSLALDTGTLTQSVNGTTTTLSANADQIFRLVTGNDPDCIINCGRSTWVENKILNYTNFLASFDLSQQSTKTTATSGQASGTNPTMVNSAAIPTGVGRFSGFTTRYQLLNKLDPRSNNFKTAWQKQVVSLGANVKTIGDETDAVYSILESHSPISGPDRDGLVQGAQTTLIQAAANDPSGQQLLSAFENFWVAVTSEALQDPQLASAVSKVMRDRGIYRAAWFNAVQAAVGTLLTFEHSYNRPLDQPETHDFKVIYAYNFGTRGMLTFNGAVSIYGGSLPAAAKYGRLHDGQVSAQYDRTLSGRANAMQTQFSLAGYWQYQPNPSVLNIPAGTVAPGTNVPLPNGTQEFVGTAGSLWVTQAKFTIKGSGGINIPIAVSWSNKKDLLQGSKVGAQVGISYNFSSLGSLFGVKQ